MYCERCGVNHAWEHQDRISAEDLDRVAWRALRAACRAEVPEATTMFRAIERL